jgi:hypothetical protein
MLVSETQTADNSLFRSALSDARLLGSFDLLHLLPSSADPAHVLSQIAGDYQTLVMKGVNRSAEISGNVRRGTQSQLENRFCQGAMGLEMIVQR